MASSPPPFPSTALVIPPSGVTQLSLANYNAAAAPKVCVIGDSRSTESANVLFVSESQYDLLRQEFQRQRPDKPNQTFSNFAIGGANSANLFQTIAASGLGAPAFAVNTSMTWISYLQAANPNLIVMSLGINAVQSYQATYFKQFLTQVASWVTTPTLAARSTAYSANAIATDSNGVMIEAQNAGTTGAGAPTYSTAQYGTTVDGTVTWVRMGAAAYSQPTVPDVLFIPNSGASSVDGAAHLAQYIPYYAGTSAMVRSMVRSQANGMAISGLPNLGLIDIGRYFTQAVYGYDPDDQYLTPTITAGNQITGITSFPYNLPAVPYGDFDVTLSFPTQALTIFNAGAVSFDVSLSPYTAGGFIHHLHFLYGGGFIGTTYYNDAFSIGGTSLSLVSGDLIIRIVKRNERIVVQIQPGGSTTTTVMDKRLTCYQMAYTPQVYFTGTPVGGTSMNVTGLNLGMARLTQPYLSMDQTFGTTTIDGNQQNHQSSRGVMGIEALVIQNLRLAS